MSSSSGTVAELGVKSVRVMRAQDSLRVHLRHKTQLPINVCSNKVWVLLSENYSSVPLLPKSATVPLFFIFGHHLLLPSSEPSQEWSPKDLVLPLSGWKKYLDTFLTLAPSMSRYMMRDLPLRFYKRQHLYLQNPEWCSCNVFQIPHCHVLRKFNGYCLLSN